MNKYLILKILLCIDLLNSMDNIENNIHRIFNKIISNKIFSVAINSSKNFFYTIKNKSVRGGSFLLNGMKDFLQKEVFLKSQ